MGKNINGLISIVFLSLVMLLGLVIIKVVLKFENVSSISMIYSIYIASILFVMILVRLFLNIVNKRKANNIINI